MTADQDWSDPEFVVGAVISQLEDLDLEDKRKVLRQVQAQLAPNEGAIEMSEADLRSYAIDQQRQHDSVQQDGGYADRCALCNYTRHPCDTYDLATAVLELLDRG